LKRSDFKPFLTKVRFTEKYKNSILRNQDNNDIYTVTGTEDYENIASYVVKINKKNDVYGCKGYFPFHLEIAETQALEEYFKLTDF
jgi:hypothetical protein